MLNLDNIVSNKNENKNNNWPFRVNYRTIRFG